LVLAVSIGVIFGQGCGSGRSKPTVGLPTANERLSQESVNSLAESLRKQEDIEGIGSELQRINAYLENREQEKPRPLSNREREVLTKEYGLANDELAEIDTAGFSSLDAHYLESCFLMRDAARSLKVEKLPAQEQAAAAFAWVMRQVRLFEPGTAAKQPAKDILPPIVVLRRGWGTAQDRALVFLALLGQLGIDGCVVTVPVASEGQAAVRTWVTGALVNKDIYLFDTRMGLPVPGAKGEGVATLAQVRTQPDILLALGTDSHYPYDVPPALAKRAQAFVACQLSALAPRMALLEEAMASGDKIYLRTDPVAVFQRFREAVQGPAFADSNLGVWNSRADKNDSMRVLRSFLPKAQGGTDDGRRLQESLAALVPFQYLPKLVLQLPGEPGKRLQAIYANPFIAFSTSPHMPREQMAAWLPGLIEQVDGEKKTPEWIMRGRLPRDMVLRGKLNEATDLLVALLREMQRQTALLQTPGLEEQAREWGSRALETYSALIQAKAQQNKARVAVGGLSLAEATEKENDLWKKSKPVMELVQGAAAIPMSDEITYQLAACKHEQAEQAQVKLDSARRNGKSVSANEKAAANDSWKAAISWWQTYLDEHPASSSAPAARRMRARALEAIGERAEAIALLEDLSGNIPPIDKTGRLYLAKQLKSRESSPSK